MPTKPQCARELMIKLPLVAKGYADGIYCMRPDNHRGQHKSTYSGLACDRQGITNSVDTITITWATDASE